MQNVAQTIAGLLHAMANCEQSGNAEWHTRHGMTLSTIVREYLPSGSGIDNGTSLDRSRSTPERLVFETAFHHMNEHGFYDGWTAHTVTVRASLAYGLDIRISGRNRNDIKDHLYDVFGAALELPVHTEYLRTVATSG